jgi:hypothetical protein
MERIEALLEGARNGESGLLVIRGEAGIGKSTLLRAAEGPAEGMAVLRSTGIESEHELPYAALHQLVRPHMNLLDRLPEPQAAGLRGAFGLTFEGVPVAHLVHAFTACFDPATTGTGFSNDLWPLVLWACVGLLVAARRFRVELTAAGGDALRPATG